MLFMSFVLSISSALNLSLSPVLSMSSCHVFLACYLFLACYVFIAYYMFLACHVFLICKARFLKLLKSDSTLPFNPPTPAPNFPHTHTCSTEASSQWLNEEAELTSSPSRNLWSSVMTSFRRFSFFFFPSS